MTDTLRPTGGPREALRLILTASEILQGGTTRYVLYPGSTLEVVECLGSTHDRALELLSEAVHALGLLGEP